MELHTFTLRNNLRPRALALFETLLAYCGTGLEEPELIREDERQAVRFRARPGADVAQIRRLMESAAERARREVEAPTKVVFEVQGAQGAPPDRHAEVIGRECVAIEEGLYIFGPAFTRLMRALDQVCLGLARRLGAQEYTVPAYTTWEVLEASNYVRLFPQHLTFGHVLEHDLDAVERFATARSREEQQSMTRPSPLVMLPAACLHCYTLKRDQRIDDPLLMTVVGHCSRYEARRMTYPGRLWNFHLREIVYLGSLPGAAAFRRQIVDELSALAGQIGLPCRLESATDPFFTSARAGLAFYQHASDLKYELVGALPGGDRSLAIASLNYHQQHFSQSFNLRDGAGELLHTACLGFGLERWAYWLLSHLGDDERNWPEILRDGQATAV
ncbi:hypothetical protein [Sorangium sp. So ce854]|uniref:hypothetical protein n=1 Tax=Sorangium sp. So ce854 TaxID=3133322 RepID=UPI003F5F8C3B